MAERPAAPANDFKVRLADDFAIVTTPDEIDVGNAAVFREALLAAALRGQPSIIVDMTATEFCDSTGLNVLVRALRRVEEAGGEIRLVVVGAAIQRILGITGVASMFGIYPSLDAALLGEADGAT